MDLYMCYVDFEKAFDMVGHELWMKSLVRMRVDAADSRALVNLYWGQKAVLRIRGEMSGWTEISRGVRQGCVLSPDLFLLCFQAVMDELQRYGRNSHRMRQYQQ